MSLSIEFFLRRMNQKSTTLRMITIHYTYFCLKNQQNNRLCGVDPFSVLFMTSLGIMRHTMRRRSFRYIASIKVITFHIINFILIFSLTFHVPCHISPFLLQECLSSSGWRRTPRTVVMRRPAAFRANPCIHKERTIFAGHRHHRFWGTCVCVKTIIIVSWRVRS